MKFKHKKAFTLIEIMVSVIIVSLVVTGILKQQSNNSKMSVYLLKRGDSELSNGLFLTKNAQRYNEENKTAYDLLVHEFVIEDLESREVLKKIDRQIHITEDIKMPVKMDESSGQEFMFYTNEILLKEKYPARYYTFKQ